MRISCALVCLVILLPASGYSFDNLLEVWEFSLLTSFKTDNQSFGHYSNVPEPEYKEIEIQFWSSEEAATSGTAQIDMAFSSPITDMLHRKGVCDFMDAESRHIQCRPDADGKGHLSITTDSNFRLADKLNRPTNDNEWYILFSDGNKEEDLTIYLNNRRLTEPLWSETDISRFEKEEALKILQQLIENERLREGIEYEAKQRRRARKAIEQTYWILRQKEKVDPKTIAAKQAKKRNKTPFSGDTGLKPAPHFIIDQKQASNVSESVHFESLNLAARGPRVDILLSQKKHGKNSNSEAMDSGNSEKTEKQIQAKKSLRGREGLGAGQGGSREESRERNTSAGITVDSRLPQVIKGSRGRGYVRGRGYGYVRGRGRGVIRSQTGNQPATVLEPLVKTATESLSKDGEEKPASATNPEDLTDRTAEQRKSKPATPETQTAASEKPEVCIKLNESHNEELSELRDQLTKWYKHKNHTAEALDEIFTQIKLKRDLFAYIYEEDMRIIALLADYWRLKATLEDSSHSMESLETSRYQVEYIEKKMKKPDFKLDDWKDYFEKVIKWYENHARHTKKLQT